MLYGIEWEQLLLWGTGLSVGAVIVTLLGVPWVVTRLPSNYFVQERREAWRASSGEPFLAWVMSLLKNLLGFVLVILGGIMLVTPGQGLLTLLAGLLLMNFPGKYRLERWLVKRPGVMRALNWLRSRHQQPPFEVPAE